MECRENCNACCIAPSINHPIPNMPHGKPAGVVCANIDTATMKCRIWGTADYPHTCMQFAPSKENCGDSREEAIAILTNLEHATSP